MSRLTTYRASALVTYGCHPRKTGPAGIFLVAEPSANPTLKRMMSRRRKLPSPHRFEDAAVTGVAADLESLAAELVEEESARGEMSDLDELAHALNVAIDGLSFLQHVLESHAQRDRAAAAGGRARRPRD